MEFLLLTWNNVETVCLLSKLSETKNHISVKVDLDEMDVTAAESKATYQEIQDWGQEKDGFHVSNLNIAKTKRKFIFMMVREASWFHIIVIAIMVVFLSLGASNQPGSILIGTLTIALFLKADVLIPTAVYLEVFFESIQNLINVTGDMVTVAIEEKEVWKSVS